MRLLGLDLVFPPRCAGCGAGPWPFCADCGRSLIAFGRPWCSTCGLPLERDSPSCRQCPSGPLDRARSAFLFDGPARSAVHRLKFSGWRQVAAALAVSMSAAAGDLPEHVVTWVPLSRRRRARRGFDQAELLARAFAEERRAEAVPLLVRLRDTAPQARKGGAERRTALRGSFAAARPVPPGVLLVDDVMTTGSTAEACAEALVRGGARQICLVTAARSVSASMPRRYTRSGLAPGSVVARGNFLR